MNISVIATNENITIYKDGRSIVINKTKAPATFEKVLKRVEKNDTAWLDKNFDGIQKEIEAKTDGVMTVKDGRVILKGTDIEVPKVIVKKLIELENERAPIMPLLRFWRKLSQNPSENSRNDLYEFMQKNNIPITEDGNIVTEKGVTQVSGSYSGHLVDSRTKTLNNSIGEIVTMPREKVDADSNQTCSKGLHVAAPDYVRNHYGSHILIECIVDPRDVVSVPKDYNATKMRVCAYRVAGYAKKESRKADEVVKLSDFMVIPDLDNQEKIEKSSDSKVKIPRKKVLKAEKKEYDLEDKTGKEIIKHVFELTGELIKITPKSKKAIIRKAEKILEIHNIKNK